MKSDIFDMHRLGGGVPQALCTQITEPDQWAIITNMCRIRGQQLLKVEVGFPLQSIQHLYVIQQARFSMECGVIDQHDHQEEQCNLNNDKVFWFHKSR